MAGRRPKPTALHRLQGTYHTGKHGRDRAAEPIARGDLADPPEDLTPSQREVWRYAVEHAPAGVLKMIDRDVLLIWVEARDRWNQARLMQAKIDHGAELKLLVRGPQGLAPSPYNDILDKTAKTLFRAAQDLGFSPAARPRIHLAPEAAALDTANPWSSLRLVEGGRSG